MNAITEATAMNDVTNATLSIDELMLLVRNEEEFKKYFKKKAHVEEMGKGHWKSDGKKGYRLTLPDGSYIRIKFFDTIKIIYNSKNVEVPGRESFLSYIDVVVAPFGIKAYGFNIDMAQCVMAYAKGRPPAKDTHAINIAKLYKKAEGFGIELTPAEFETYFAKHFSKN